MNSKDKGNLTEAAILFALLDCGATVLQVFGDNARYDLAFDAGGKLRTVQCKTAKYEEGFISFATCSSQNHRGKGKESYIGQCDFFGVYCKELQETYLIPVYDCPKTEMRLRLSPTKGNNQYKKQFADTYKLSLCVETLHGAPKEY